MKAVISIIDDDGTILLKDKVIQPSKGYTCDYPFSRTEYFCFKFTKALFPERWTKKESE